MHVLLTKPSCAVLCAVLGTTLLALHGCGSTPRNDAPEPTGPASQVAGRATPPAPVPAPEPAREPSQAAVPATPTDIEAALAYDDADPLANLEAADALDRMGKAEPLPSTAPPKNGCVVLDAGARWVLSRRARRVLDIGSEESHATA